MAGIGFELRRMVGEGKGLVSHLRAWTSAGLVSSGPWIVTIGSLLAAGLATERFASRDTAQAFLAVVTWCFALSLVVLGGVQMAFTRWLADALYARRHASVAPAFTAALAATAALQAGVGIALCRLAGFDAALTVPVVWLYVVIGLLWIAQVWLTVIRQFERILIAYALGALVFGLLLAAKDGALGVADAVGAFAAGQSLSLVLMVGLVLRGVDAPDGGGGGVCKSPLGYPLLFAVGALYSLGIWIDKLVFWFVAGVETMPMVRAHPLYDTCFFLAYTTVVPALTVNLVHFETSFYERYRGYFRTILGARPLAEIEDARAAMVASLRDGAVRLLRIQGAVTVACIVFARPIVTALGMPEFAARVFRFGCAGALCHALLLVTVLVQLYFDLQRTALATSAVFLLLNGALAWWSVHAGPDTYGLGYAIAAACALLLGFTLLSRAVHDLDRRVFQGQLDA